MTGASPEPGSYEQALHKLLDDALDGYDEESPSCVTMCAPRWVVERVSDESRQPIESNKGILSVATRTIVVTAVPALEQESGLGLLAAIDVIGGRCVEITVCHPDVAPGRWPDLTLALGYGLGPEVSVAVETLGTSLPG
jgi:hypothetical protein